ncbi:MAG TPA: hypothetical protein VJ377_05620 [Dehalococcoidales bacterium]|nr:hypothetical protein [Dehalococcoidales bacterium]
MDSYYLTEEGRARFRRRKIVLETEPPNNDDKMMDYLFGHTSGTVEELVAATGLTYDYVSDKLLVFMNHGLIQRSS